MSLYYSETLEKFHKCLQLVHQNLNTAAPKHTNILNIPQYFEIGDEVYMVVSPVLSVNIPESFTEFWTGPYTVTKITSLVIVHIQHINKPTKKGFVHVSRLKKKF